LLQKRCWQKPQSPVMACAAALQGGWAQRGFRRALAEVGVGVDLPEVVVMVVVVVEVVIGVVVPEVGVSVPAAAATAAAG